MTLICGYSLQCGRSFEEKQTFYYALICELDMSSADDLVMCFGDLNGHIHRHVDEVHGGYDVGHRNLKGRMLFQFCLEKEFCVSNTWFKRGKEEGDIQNGEK